MPSVRITRRNGGHIVIIFPSGDHLTFSVERNKLGPEGSLAVDFDIPPSLAYLQILRIEHTRRVGHQRLAKERGAK